MSPMQRRGRLSKWSWKRRANERPHKAAALADRHRKASNPPAGAPEVTYVWDPSAAGWSWEPSP